MEIGEEEDLPVEEKIYFDIENVYNQRLIRVWNLCYNQFIFCGDSPTALDLKCLPLLFDAVAVPKEDWEETIKELKLLSYACLQVIWETRKKQLEKNRPKK